MHTHPSKILEFTTVQYKMLAGQIFGDFTQGTLAFDCQNCIHSIYLAGNILVDLLSKSTKLYGTTFQTVANCNMMAKYVVRVTISMH